jgi:hypothetical protein
LKLIYNQKDLMKQVEAEISSNLTMISENVRSDLQSVTPKDTGEASRSWSIEIKPKGFDITNDEDYVKYLNAGSSSQAPANFIEKVALNYGNPKGAIVEYES